MEEDYAIDSITGEKVFSISKDEEYKTLLDIKNHLNDFKTAVKYDMIYDMILCQCSKWVDNYDDHQSGSGMGSTCRRTNIPLPYFESVNIGYIHYPPNCNDKSKFRSRVGALWIEDWNNFDRWISRTVNTRQIDINDINIDLSKLTRNEEMEFRRLVNKMT